MPPIEEAKHVSRWIDELAEQDYAIIDNFFEDDTLKLINTFFKGKELDFQPAKVGQASIEKRVPEIRTDLTYWLDRARDESLLPFFVKVESVMEELKYGLFLSLQGYEFHFALYPSSGFYRPHLDQFDARSNRMISMIIYLNQDWHLGDGGELRIHKEGLEIDVQPIMNRCVIFRSDCLLHEVLKANKPRRSLTGWLLKRPSGVGVLGI